MSLLNKEIAVFAKEGKSQDGHTYTRYISKVKKGGDEEVAINVKFKKAVGAPREDDCPCNILLKSANMKTDKWQREDTGEEALSYTLWVNDWEMGSVYVDTSLDEFDV